MDNVVPGAKAHRVKMTETDLRAFKDAFTDESTCPSSQISARWEVMLSVIYRDSHHPLF